jgi:hypothetical protein
MRAGGGAPLKSILDVIMEKEIPQHPFPTLNPRCQAFSQLTCFDHTVYLLNSTQIFESIFNQNLPPKYIFNISLAC